jgi:hypothetical protein
MPRGNAGVSGVIEDKREKLPPRAPIPRTHSGYVDAYANVAGVELATAGSVSDPIRNRLDPDT